MRTSMADQEYRPSVLCASHTPVTEAPQSLTKEAQTGEKHYGEHKEVFG